MDRFVVMGASGGGPHALACAGRLADRVLGVVCLAGVAPFEAAGLDWFAAMGESGAAEFRAAAAGRDALAAHLATGARIEGERTVRTASTRPRAAGSRRRPRRRGPRIAA